MRISDWSSDVCSSDLGAAAGVAATRPRSLGDAAAGGHVAREVVPHRRARRKERSLPVVQGWIWARGRRRPSPRKRGRSEEHTSELQSLMRISYAVFCLKKKKNLVHTTILLIIIEPYK